MTCLGRAASTTKRVLVPTLVRRASTPRYRVSRCANASYGPSMRSTVSHGAISSPSYSAYRSEEHTSELQSRLHLVCRLLLEKKKKKMKQTAKADSQSYRC